METTNRLSYRPVEESDFEIICHFPQNADELFFMFPKAEYPFTTTQLKTAINSRSDSTVILSDNEIVGFANFYEVKENQYCSIGNVIVSPTYRNKGLGTFLINTMEHIGKEKYHISEIHISCFNTNIVALLLYAKLGYKPFEIEKRFDKKENQLALIKMKQQM